MKVGKPKSKRVPVRLRHKIEKASAAKQRKQRKEAKKNPQWRSRLKKDPGIPNLFPYKDRVLAEIEEGKRRKAQEQERKREVARARREGKSVEEMDEEELMDPEDLDDEDEESEGEGEEMEEDTNPMAALVASAQARARTYAPEDDEDEEDDDDEDEDFASFEDKKSKATPSEPARKSLPKQALADPIKAVTTLITRLQQTTHGIQQILDFYQLPPLVTAGSDTTTRFLVDVARKRGRLGRRGVPNLNAAALTVLSDLNEERLKLPALQQVPQTQANSAAENKGEVQVVSQLAEPFRIEGLFGDSVQAGAEMEVEDD